MQKDISDGVLEPVVDATPAPPPTADAAAAADATPTPATPAPAAVTSAARCCSYLRTREPSTRKERVCKLLPDQTYLSLNHLARLNKAVKLVVDTASKSKPKSRVLTAGEKTCIEAAL